MEIDSSDNPNWLFDYGVEDAIPPDFAARVAGAFDWSSQVFTVASSVSVKVDGSFGDSDSLKDVGPRKRLRSESFNASGSKACREKLRRDKLNERFLELCSMLEPGKPPRLDKAAILGEAVRMVNLLRREAQKLQESKEGLQDKIKELKAEKIELRDEKQRLKADKENLDQQVKAMNAQPAGNKLMPFIGYPGVAMWQFMPPGTTDTSEDHVLRPPVA